MNGGVDASRLAYAGLAIMSPMYRAMRWPVRRAVRLGSGAVRSVMRHWRTVRPVAWAVPAVRLMPGPTMRLVGRAMRRSVVGPVVRRAGFSLFHENDGWSGHGHAHEGGETKEEGTAAYLLGLGRAVHSIS